MFPPLIQQQTSNLSDIQVQIIGQLRLLAVAIDDDNWFTIEHLDSICSKIQNLSQIINSQSFANLDKSYQLQVYIEFKGLIEPYIQMGKSEASSQETNLLAEKLESTEASKIDTSQVLNLLYLMRSDRISQLEILKKIIGDTKKAEIEETIDSLRQAVQHDRIDQVIENLTLIRNKIFYLYIGTISFIHKEDVLRMYAEVRTILGKYFDEGQQRKLPLAEKIRSQDIIETHMLEMIRLVEDIKRSRRNVAESIADTDDVFYKVEAHQPSTESTITQNHIYLQEPLPFSPTHESESEEYYWRIQALPDDNYEVENYLELKAFILKRFEQAGITNPKVRFNDAERVIKLGYGYILLQQIGITKHPFFFCDVFNDAFAEAQKNLRDGNVHREYNNCMRVSVLQHIKFLKNALLKTSHEFFKETNIPERTLIAYERLPKIPGELLGALFKRT